MVLNDTSIRIKVINALQQAGVGFSMIRKIFKGGAPPVSSRFGFGVIRTIPRPPPKK